MKLVEDFQNQEPLGGSYLAGVKPVKGSYDETPFLIKLTFPAHLSFPYKQFTQSDVYPKKFQIFLEDILGREVKLSSELESTPADEKSTVLSGPPARNPKSLFQEEMKKEPILRKLVEIFDAELKSVTRTVSKPKEVAYEYSKDDERNAEDAGETL